MFFYKFSVVLLFTFNTVSCLPIPDFQRHIDYIEIERKDVEHGLGEIPLLVDVQVQPVDGYYSSFYFPGVGTSTRDDDEPFDYGCVIYSYNDKYIMISTPIKNNDHQGAAIFLQNSYFWEGQGVNYTSLRATVHIRAWRATALPNPDFVHTGTYMKANGLQNETYVEKQHHLGEYPGLVIVRLVSPNNNLILNAVGATFSTFDDMVNQNSYVVYGYDNSNIRVWTMDSEFGEQNVYYYARGDGNGFGFGHMPELTGTLEIYAWTISSLPPTFTTEISLGINDSIFLPEIQLPVFYDLRASLVKVTVHSLSGINEGYRFEGTGSMAYSDIYSPTSCRYGGLVCGYNESSITMWKPTNTYSGTLICISDLLAEGFNTQASHDGKAILNSWFINGMLQASYHQGDARFQGNGRQCMANALTSIIHHSNENVLHWTTETLDQILHEGNDLYLNISKDQDVEYLMLCNLPESLNNFSIKISAPLAGLVHQTSSEPPFFNIEGAVHELEKQSKSYAGYILTIGHSTPCYTMAIMKSSENYYVFDSHCRSETGMVSQNGKATMTLHQSTFSLCLFLKHLTNSLYNKVDISFEIAAVTIYDISEYKEINFEESEFDLSSESEFSGFEEYDTIIDESIVQTKIKLLNHTIEMDLDSEVSSICSEDVEIINENVTNLDDSALFLQSVDINSFSDTNYENLQNCVDIIQPSEINLDDCEQNENITNEDISRNITIDIILTSNETNEETNEQLKDLSESEQIYETSTTEDENIFPLSYLRKKTQRQKRKRRQTLNTSKTLNEKNNNVNYDSSTEEISDVENIVNQLNENNGTNTQRGRKRTRQEGTWARNIAKKRRNEGKSYVSRNNTNKSSRTMRPPCGHLCRYHCTEQFDDKDREKVFHTYWALGTVTKQRQFLCNYANKKAKRRNKHTISRRENSFRWTLPSDEGHPVTVCKTFFLNTLSISNQSVTTAHINQKVGVSEEERRGKSKGSRSNKIHESRYDTVREHISSFPTMESHYCRKNSNRKYLHPALSVSKMFYLYVDICKSRHLKPVTIFGYRYIFNTEYNLGFSKPKKDLCDLCTSYKNSRNSEKDLIEDEYRVHLKNKVLSRENKERDKKRAQKDSKLCVAAFDLEQVLVTPKGFESSLYYKRQLNNYNFTLYDLGNCDGYSYLWNESIAGRGASEIASCVHHFIDLKVSEGKKKFIFYSDNCIPQNKNKFYVSMLWFCLKKYNIISIKHKYLEKGHTQNENDSIHSSIERISRNISIYTTGQWAACIMSARKNHPFIVKEMCLLDFFDFKSIAEQLNNFELDANKQKVYWNGIRLLKFSSDNPDTFLFKYNYEGVANSVNLFSRIRRSQYCRDLPNPKVMKLRCLRPDLIPISIQKYNDLISLCLADIVPKVHHVFYILLPHECD